MLEPCLLLRNHYKGIVKSSVSWSNSSTCWWGSERFVKIYLANKLLRPWLLSVAKWFPASACYYSPVNRCLAPVDLFLNFFHLRGMHSPILTRKWDPSYNAIMWMNNIWGFPCYMLSQSGTSSPILSTRSKDYWIHADSYLGRHRGTRILTVMASSSLPSRIIQ
jgi:hypothetical protein